MLPKRFDQARPFVLLGIGFLVWIFVPTVIKRFFRGTIVEFQAPIEASASAIRSIQDYWSLRTRSKDELIEAIKDVSHQNASYEVGAVQYAELTNRAKRMEELLRLPSYPQFRTEVSRVIRRDFGTWWQRLVIQKGRTASIPVGAPVIFVGGVVGRVSEVNEYTSVVELISSPGVRIAASIEGDTRPISYQGGINPTFGPAKGVVDFVPLDVFANRATPKRLVTSGFGGIFPAGLNLGEIVNLEKGGDGLFQTGEVQIDPRLVTVTEVAVLVPIGPTEAVK